MAKIENWLRSGPNTVQQYVMVLKISVKNIKKNTRVPLHDGMFL